VKVLFALADIIQCTASFPGEYRLCNYSIYLFLFGVQLKTSLGAVSSLILWTLVSSANKFQKTDCERLLIFMILFNLARILLIISYDGASMFCPHGKNSDFVKAGPFSTALIFITLFNFLFIALDVMCLWFFSFRSLYRMKLQGGNQGFSPNIKPVATYLLLICCATTGEFF
jgi:hypothetical protein